MQTKRTLASLASLCIALTATAQTEHPDTIVPARIGVERSDVIGGIVGNGEAGGGEFKTSEAISVGKETEMPRQEDFQTIDLTSYRIPNIEENLRMANIALSSSHERLPGLGEIRRAELDYTLRTGRWMLDATVAGEKYQFQTTAFNNLAIGGSVTYELSEHWSLTAFGIYSTGRHYYSMAAYPYITQSQFGGTVNYRSDRFGMRMGARQFYDPFQHRWVSEPIVAPSVRIGKMRFETDFGPLLHELLERAMFGKRKYGPNIMPQMP